MDLKHNLSVQVINLTQTRSQNSLSNAWRLLILLFIQQTPNLEHGKIRIGMQGYEKMFMC